MDWKCSLETMSLFFLRLVWQTSTCLIELFDLKVEKSSIDFDYIYWYHVTKVSQSGWLLLLSCVNRKSSNNSQTWWFLSTIYLTWKFFDIWRIFSRIWKKSVFLTRNCCEFGSIATTICESSCVGWENGLHLYFAAFSVSILIDIHR